MTAVQTPTSKRPGYNPRQLIKLVVYVLLLANFGYYFIEEWGIASHTRRNGGSLLEWTAAFAVSINELACFVLLFLFELETYVLSDDALKGYRLRLIHGTRLLCYLFLAHTQYTYMTNVHDLGQLTPVEGSPSLCQLVEEDISFAFNLEYTQLTGDNCGDLSSNPVLYFIEDGAVVTDAPGLVIEKQLAWIDLMEATVWLFLLFSIELIVRLQDRGITDGMTIRSVSRIKFLLYGSLWGAAGYWLFRGHWVYAWGEALWIFGFAAIEMNISEWKQEIIEAEAATAAETLS
jgi:hypothetical protein